MMIDGINQLPAPLFLPKGHYCWELWDNMKQGFCPAGPQDIRRSTQLMRALGAQLALLMVEYLGMVIN